MLPCAWRRYVTESSLLRRFKLLRHFSFYETMLTINVGLMAERSLYRIAHRHVQRGEALAA
jgi:hypothetical protein